VAGGECGREEPLIRSGEERVIKAGRALSGNSQSVYVLLGGEPQDHARRNRAAEDRVDRGRTEATLDRSPVS
jgi:hypothetical protein